MKGKGGVYDRDRNGECHTRAVMIGTKLRASLQRLLHVLGRYRLPEGRRFGASSRSEGLVNLGIGQ